MMVKEMIKLREALDALGIAWKDVSDNLITRTHFVINGVPRSVIHGAGTYGGQADLLEVMPPLDYGSNNVSKVEDVQGCVTAQEIINALFPLTKELPICPVCGKRLDFWDSASPELSDDYLTVTLEETWVCENPDCENDEDYLVTRVFKEDMSKREITTY